MSKSVDTIKLEIREQIKSKIMDALKNKSEITDIDISEYIKNLYGDKNPSLAAFEYIMKEYFAGNEEIQRCLESHIFDTNPELFSNLSIDYLEELRDYYVAYYACSGIIADPLVKKMDEYEQAYTNEITSGVFIKELANYFIDYVEDLEDDLDSISTEIRSTLEKLLIGEDYSGVLEAIEQGNENLEEFNRIIAIMKQTSCSAINFNAYPKLAECFDDSQNLYECYKNINLLRKILTDFRHIIEDNYYEFYYGIGIVDTIPTRICDSIARSIKDWSFDKLYKDGYFEEDKSKKDKREEFSILQYLPENLYFQILNNMAKKFELEIVASPICENGSFLDKYKFKSNFILNSTSDEDFDVLIENEEQELSELLKIEELKQAKYLNNTYREISMYDPYTRMRKKSNDYRDDYCDDDDYN